MRKESEILKDEPDGAFFGREEDVGSGDLAAVQKQTARRLALDASCNPEQCRLAGARWAKKAKNFARFGSKRDIAYHGRTAPEAMADIVKVEACRERHARSNAVYPCPPSRHDAHRPATRRILFIVHPGREQSKLLQVDVGQRVLFRSQCTRI